MRAAAIRLLMPGAALMTSAKPAEPASSLSTKEAISRISSPRTRAGTFSGEVITPPSAR